MKTFLALHHHEYGISSLLFQSEDDYDGVLERSNLTEEEAQEFVNLSNELGFDLEWDEKDEWVEFIPIEINNIPIIKKA